MRPTTSRPAGRTTTAKSSEGTRPARGAKAVKRTKAAPAARPGAPQRPFLRFYHPAPLRRRTLAVLDGLESSGRPTQHAEALAEVVVELTRCGLDTYFIQSLKRSKAGFIVEQSAALGLGGAVKVIAAVIRNVIGGMGAPQLLSVSASIRAFMR